MPRSGFLQIPNEVVEQALSYLDWKEWLAMGTTSKRFREVSASDRLWERDYDRMKHILGSPDVSEGFRSVSVAARPSNLQEGTFDRFKRAVTWKLPTIAINTSRVLTRSQPGKDKLRLVTATRNYEMRRAIHSYASGVDIFKPGSNLDRTAVFSRFPRVFDRDVSEASGMIASLHSYPLDSNKTRWFQENGEELEYLEQSWADRTSEIPLLVFLPKAKSRSSTRAVIDTLRSAFPGVPFRVQPCDLEADTGIAEGMQWIIQEAGRERARRESDGVEPAPPKRSILRAIRSQKAKSTGAST